MRPLVFVDLDDTLFHSQRKCSAGDRAAVAFAREGQALSFMSPRQQAFFEWLARDADVVPTTGRNAEAFRRVRLPFSGHAICSFGGLVLTPHGRPEPRWQAQVEEEAAPCRHELHEVLGLVRSHAERAACDVKSKVVAEGDVDLYLSVKHAQADAAELCRLAPRVRELLPPGWRLLHNDNHLEILPPFLGKERAVAWFIEQYAEPGSFALGVGDSLADAAFMSQCDYALCPTRSQLFSRLSGS